MPAPVVRLREPLGLDDAVRAINAKLVAADESEGKSTRFRLQAGEMLNELRQRIEGGEAGSDVKWWPWYKSKFGRSRRDAEKIMKLAGAEDPEAAHDEEKAQAAERMKRGRSAANVRRDQELQDDNRVEHILQLIDRLDPEERDELLAAIQEKWL